MPPKGSCLYNSMEEIQQQMKRGKATFLTKLAYGPSHADPVAASSYSPDDWYLSRFNHFIWTPMDSFGTMVDLKRIKCIRCKKSNCLQKKDIAWRPMICHDKVTWVLHNRLKCKDCGGSFASIDPDFLSQLPTRIVERFPFVTRKVGPGIHQYLVCNQRASLLCHNATVRTTWHTARLVIIATGTQ